VEGVISHHPLRRREVAEAIREGVAAVERVVAAEPLLLRRREVAETVGESVAAVERVAAEVPLRGGEIAEPVGEGIPVEGIPSQSPF